MVDGKVRYNARMKGIEGVGTPEKEKPPFLYHGSSASGLGNLEPHRRYIPSEDVAERVYASDSPSFAAAHSFPWGTNEGFDLSTDNDTGKIILRVPSQFRERLQQKVYLYKVPSEKFRWTTEEGTGNTLHTSEEVPVADVQEFNSAQDAIEFFGGEVVYE